MASSIFRCAFFLTGSCLFLAPTRATAALQADGYILSVVGTLPAPYSAQSVPDAINDSGQVLIDSGANSSIHAAIYTSGSLQDLKTLPAPFNSFVYGSGINSLGQACGISWDGANTTYHGFLFSNGSMTDLGTLPGYSHSSQAKAINNAGQVVGDSETATTAHAFLYSGNGLKDLGTLPGYLSSTATAINNSGVIVGYSFATYGPTVTEQAFVDGATGMTALGTLPAPYNAGSEAFGINDNGDIVGASLDSAGDSHAFLWSKGVMTDLGTLPGFTSSSIAFQINDSDQITGYSTSPTNGTDYFMYSGAAMTNLSQTLYTAFPGWELENFGPINDNGQLAVGGYSPGSVFQTVVLTPVPEPTAALSISTALTLLALQRRRAN